MYVYIHTDFKGVVVVHALRGDQHNVSLPLYIYIHIYIYPLRYLYIYKHIVNVFSGFLHQ